MQRFIGKTPDVHNTFFKWSVEWYSAFTKLKKTEEWKVPEELNSSEIDITYIKVYLGKENTKVFWGVFKKQVKITCDRARTSYLPVQICLCL